MTETIDLYWSFRSPYSYLAIPDILRLRQDYDVAINFKVVLPIAVRAKASLFASGNRKPAMYILLDSKRRAEYLDIPYSFPPDPDPIVQDYETLEVAEEQPYIYRLCKLGVEANRRQRGIEFADSVSRLIMGGTKGWNIGDKLKNAVTESGLELEPMDEAIKDGDHMTEIESNHADLEQAGHWGVPTLVVRNEPFFGQDRIETLRWRLDQLNLSRSSA